MRTTYPPEPFADDHECELCGARRSPFWEVDGSGRVYCSGRCMSRADQSRYLAEQRAAERLNGI